MSELNTVLKNKMVWICALGYFVDMFDLVLFGIVRIPSLKALGVAEIDIQKIGAQLLNYQMTGLIIGGFFWGLMGDKVGRLKTLFASIFLYSLANLLNAFIINIDYYAFLRFLAGFGLAGELGVAVTLIAEILPKNNRGFGTTIIGFAGFLGAICAALTARYSTWKIIYLIGGIIGFILLITRLSAHESILFSKSNQKNQFHKTIKLLFTSRDRVWRYFKLILVGIPIWFVSGILIYFSPEFSKELNVDGTVLAGSAILWCYMGSLLGDIFSGYISQKLKSRKKAINFFLWLLCFVIIGYVFFTSKCHDISILYYLFFTWYREWVLDPSHNNVC